MKKIFLIFAAIIFVFSKAPSFSQETFEKCKILYTDSKYNIASKCFYDRIKADSNDIQSRFWYAASLYFDRKYYLAYEQYNYIAQKYPNSNVGRYSLQEAEKVKKRIQDIQKAKSNDTGTYLNELDKISKWNNMPVRVWIEPCTYTDTAKKAFGEWQTKTNNKVSFVFVKNPNSANIRMEFVDRLRKSDSAYNLGFTALKFSGKKNIIAKIEILQRTESNSYKTNSQLYGVMLHEIGHALGISGHSSRNNDIMFPNDFTNDVHLSQRDINTIMSIYSK